MSLNTVDSIRVNRAIKQTGVWTRPLHPPRHVHSIQDIIDETGEFLFSQRVHLAGVVESNTLRIEVASRDYHYDRDEVVPDFFISINRHNKWKRLIAVVCLPINPVQEYHHKPLYWQECTGGYSWKYGTRTTVFTNYYNWLYLETSILGQQTGRVLVHREEAKITRTKKNSVGYILAMMAWKAAKLGNVRLDEVNDY